MKLTTPVKGFVICVTSAVLSCLDGREAQSETPEAVAFTNALWFNGAAFEAHPPVYSVDGRFGFNAPATAHRIVDLKGGWIASPFAEAHNRNISNPHDEESRRRALRRGREKRAQFVPAVQPASTQGTQIIRSSLGNGLRVVINPDHTLPLVTVCVAYRVGHSDDPSHRRGLAHLLEHMMFRGSRQVSDGEYSALVKEAGGYSVGTTDLSYSYFTAVIPSNQLEMVLFMEADRMRRAQLSEAAISSEKLAVENESGRANTANFRFQFPPGLLTNVASDSRRVPELDGVSLRELRAFYDRYYQPGNAVVALAGDVDAANANALVTRSFAGIQNVASVERKQASREPERGALVHPSRKAPRLYMAFRLPSPETLDSAIMELLVRVLRGPANDSVRGRLEERGINAIIGTWEVSDGRFLVIEGSAVGDMTIGQVEAAVTEELGRPDLIGAGELEAAQNAQLLSQATRWVTPDARTQLLAKAELIDGDARGLLEQAATIRRVTAPDLRQLITDYLARTPELVTVARPAQ